MYIWENSKWYILYHRKKERKGWSIRKMWGQEADAKWYTRQTCVRSNSLANREYERHTHTHTYIPFLFVFDWQYSHITAHNTNVREMKEEQWMGSMRINGNITFHFSSVCSVCSFWIDHCLWHVSRFTISRSRPNYDRHKHICVKTTTTKRELNIRVSFLGREYGRIGFKLLIQRF